MHDFEADVDVFLGIRYPVKFSMLKKILLNKYLAGGHLYEWML